MQRLIGTLSFVALVATLSTTTRAGDWPQFRGPHGASVAVSEKPLPSELGPDKNVLWKVDVPPGHSSPAIVGTRIFLTAVEKQGDQEQLVTIGLDRATGKRLWTAAAPYEKLEAIHRIGSHAQSSPACDGERVVVFFGSSGLYCYDIDGKLLWKRPMGPFKNDFGAGSSPLIVDDYVILVQDHDVGSFLAAFDKRTGEPVWQTDRSEFPRNYCTPVIWEVDGQKQIVVAATMRVVGYDFATGKELWTVRGLSRAVCSTPVIGDDGNLYVASWSAGGDIGSGGDARIKIQPFDNALAASDANKNGTLEESEVPEGDVKQRFSQFDRDKSGSITRQEYEYYRDLFEKARNVVLSIKPGGKGEATASHVAWEHTRHVPFCASPLYYKGYIYTLKDGGIFSCLDAKTGKPTKQGRLSVTGDYYSSPVAGDGKIYTVNDEGQLAVVKAGPQWEVISTAEFGEDTHATPALVDGKIYLRTKGHLYCFGLPEKAK